MLVGAVILVITLWIIGATLMGTSYPSGTVDSFEACVAAGNPVMESYPRQCRTPDGQLFVEPVTQPIHE